MIFGVCSHASSWVPVLNMGLDGAVPSWCRVYSLDPWSRACRRSELDDRDLLSRNEILKHVVAYPSNLRCGCRILCRPLKNEVSFCVFRYYSLECFFWLFFTSFFFSAASRDHESRHYGTEGVSRLSCFGSHETRLSIKDTEAILLDPAFHQHLKGSAPMKVKSVLGTRTAEVCKMRLKSANSSHTQRPVFPSRTKPRR